jgi:hypothetical protein
LPTATCFAILAATNSPTTGTDTRAIQDYLGVRYTAFAPDRFKNFWKD